MVEINNLTNVVIHPAEAWEEIEQLRAQLAELQREHETLAELYTRIVGTDKDILAHELDAARAQIATAEREQMERDAGLICARCASPEIYTPATFDEGHNGYVHYRVNNGSSSWCDAAPIWVALSQTAAPDGKAE